MHYYSKEDITRLDHIFRINLINSCTGYKPANLIATLSSDGVSNVAVFSSVVHLGSSPALLGFMIRPTTVPRHTYTNIQATRHYTINHVHDEILADAHHTSAKYPAGISEFNKTNLEEEYKNGFDVPFVAGAPVQIAMNYVEEYHIKANDVLLIVGEIKGLYLADDLLLEDGLIDIAKGRVATVTGLDAYSLPSSIKHRFAYQRPKKDFEQD